MTNLYINVLVGIETSFLGGKTWSDSWVNYSTSRRVLDFQSNQSKDNLQLL